MTKRSAKVPESSDSEIIRKVLAGHTVWFEILIRRYNSTLYKIARGYGFNHQDSEDLIQDAHSKAFEHSTNQSQSYPVGDIGEACSRISI